MSIPVRTLANFIDGRFVPPSTGTYLDDIGPATAEVIAQVPRSNANDVDAAVGAAKKAFRGGWGAASVAVRAELCEAVARAIELRADELAELESLDTGKPIRLARTVDIPRAILNFRFFAGAIRHDQTGFHEMD